MSPGIIEDRRPVLVAEEALELGRHVRVDAEGDVPLDHRCLLPFRRLAVSASLAVSAAIGLTS